MSDHDAPVDFTHVSVHGLAGACKRDGASIKFYLNAMVPGGELRIPVAVVGSGATSLTPAPIAGAAVAVTGALSREFNREPFGILCDLDRGGSCRVLALASSAEAPAHRSPTQTFRDPAARQRQPTGLSESNRDRSSSVPPPERRLQVVGDQPVIDYVEAAKLAREIDSVVEADTPAHVRGGEPGGQLEAQPRRPKKRDPHDDIPY